MFYPYKLYYAFHAFLRLQTSHKYTQIAAQAYPFNTLSPSSRANYSIIQKTISSSYRSSIA